MRMSNSLVSGGGPEAELLMVAVGDEGEDCGNKAISMAVRLFLTSTSADAVSFVLRVFVRKEAACRWSCELQNSATAERCSWAAAVTPDEDEAATALI